MLPPRLLAACSALPPEGAAAPCGPAKPVAALAGEDSPHGRSLRATPCPCWLGVRIQAVLVAVAGTKACAQANADAQAH